MPALWEVAVDETRSLLTGAWGEATHQPSRRAAESPSRRVNLDFTDRVAIVTGAAHGFGRAIAVAFAERGANVWACDVLEDELRETRTLCVAAGGRCEVAVVDVGDKSAVDGFVGKIAAAGRTDILVNNAGGVLGQVGRPLEQISPRDWQS